MLTSGVADEKGGVAVVVHALAMLKDLGFREYGMLTVLINGDEELSTPSARNLITRARGSMRKMIGTTRLIPESTGTRIVSHGEFIPNVWVPPGIGPIFIEAETRKQFQELREEILRRKVETAPGRH